MPTLETNAVAKKSAAVAQLDLDLNMVCSLLGGTRAMRAAGTSLLPKFVNEEQKAYDIRLSQSVLFPAYGRTISTLTGKPFSRPVTLPDGLSDDWKAWFENIDLQGTNLSVYAAKTFYDALGEGLAGCIVDCPPRGDLPNTVAAEQAAGLRPYFVPIKLCNILGWKAKIIDGQWQLQQLRFYEYVEEDDGAFGTKTIKQIRVWNVGNYEIWRIAADQQDTWAQFGPTQAVSLQRVPFVPYYGRKQGFMIGTPPLIDLAFLNIKHWQSQSDQDSLLHVARVPILVVQSDDDTFKMTVGAATGVRVPVGCEVKYVEHTGAAIDAGAASLKELKDEMRQAGAELLVMRVAAATATEIGSDDDVGTCELQRMVSEFEGSLNLAISYMAEWMSIPAPERVEIYDEFGTLSVNDTSLATLLESCKGGKLSDETFFKELQRRGAVASDIKYEDEKKKIAANSQPPVPPLDPNKLPNPNDPTNKPAPKPPL